MKKPTEQIKSEIAKQLSKINIKSANIKYAILGKAIYWQTYVGKAEKRKGGLNGRCKIAENIH